MIYGADGYPATYKELTVSSFIRSYLIVLKEMQVSEVKDCMVQHLEELMEDTDLYGWEKVKMFHAAWLNQIEQCRCDWADDDQKLKLPVWHTTSGTKVMATATSTGSGKKTGSSATPYNSPAKPGTETCIACNENQVF